MRRREVVAGAGSLAVLGGGVAVATLGRPLGSGDDDREEDYSDDPVEVETVDATGSEAGTLSVPAADRVTALDFFATTCNICQDMMPVMGEAHDTLTADHDDLRFLSVTNERGVSDDELATWWDDYDGNWLLGRDAGVDLFERYEVVNVPTVVVTDEVGAVRWRAEGRKTAEELVDGVEEAYE